MKGGREYSSDNQRVNARFHAPDARSGAIVRLSEDEGRHLARVLRLKAGDRVAVFDGRGAEFEAVVEQVLGDSVDVHVGASKPAAAEPRVALTLAQAVLKGDKMDDVVRDAVMMGVAAVQPIVAARSEVKLASLLSGRRRDRWQRIAVSSAKQCGRATVPTILEPRAFDALPAALAGMTLPGPGLMFVEPSASNDTIALGDLEATAPRSTTVIIGPEGGWTAEEINRTSSACRLITLGSRTLRADAMPIVALAALFAVWKEF